MTDTYQSLAARYDKAAPRWWQKLERLSYPEAFGDLIAQTLPMDVTSAHALDAGTGCGDFALALLQSRRPASLDLLDISAEMLATAASRVAPHIQPTCLNQSLEALRPNSYDLILCAHAIEHCPDPIAALRTLRRALRPGGQLLLTVSKPHICTIFLQFLWHHRAFRPARVAQMLADVGFAQITTHPFSTGVPARLSCGYHATI